MMGCGASKSTSSDAETSKCGQNDSKTIFERLFETKEQVDRNIKLRLLIEDGRWIQRFIELEETIDKLILVKEEANAHIEACNQILKTLHPLISKKEKELNKTKTKAEKYRSKHGLTFTSTRDLQPHIASRKLQKQWIQKDPEDEDTREEDSSDLQPVSD